MKNLLQKPFVKKFIYFCIGFFIVVLILDRFVFPWYVSSPETVVPDVVGLIENAAIERLEDVSLQPVIGDTTFDQRFPKGTIILQRPKAGEIVKEGRRVHLYISGGEPIVYVPQLRGKSIRDAKFSLERLGLKLGTVEEVTSNQPKDMIFDQQFTEGTPLKKGEAVGISVSIGSGLGEIVVPDLIGKSLTEAQMILADSSLRIGKINYQRSFSLLPNTILDQYPSKGNRVNKGDAVDLFVTKSADTEAEEFIEE